MASLAVNFCDNHAYARFYNKKARNGRESVYEEVNLGTARCLDYYLEEMAFAPPQLWVPVPHSFGTASFTRRNEECLAPKKLACEIGFSSQYAPEPFVWESA